MLKKAVLLTIPFLIVACSEVSTGSNHDENKDQDNEVSDIISCDDSLDGKIVKTHDKEEYRLCENGQWTIVDIDDFDESDLYDPTAKSSSSSMEKSSSSKRRSIITDDDESEDGGSDEGNDEAGDNAEKKSSSSKATAKSSGSPLVTTERKYDCNKYNCVTTEYLNQEMLAAGKYGELLDTRDLQVYRTIKIGDQVWMAQNLNYVPEKSLDPDSTSNWCYDNKEANCSKYGRLYTWSAAMYIPKKYDTELSDLETTVHQGICPENWHVPSEAEWYTLYEYVNYSVEDLRAEDNWLSGSFSGDPYGFSVLASGNLDGEFEFSFIGENADLWATTEAVSDEAYRMNFSIHFAALTSASKWGGFSLRCLQNTTKTEFASSSSAISTSSSSQNHYNCSEYDCVTTEYLNQEMLAAGKYGELLDTRDHQVYRTIKIGDQVWMAQNLNYNATGSFCYQNIAENCNSQGRLYTWNTALGENSNSDDVIKGVCPNGFHIPSNDEYLVLAKFVGGDEVLNYFEVSSWEPVITYENSGTNLVSPKSFTEEGLKDPYGFSGIIARGRWDYGEWYNESTGGTDLWTSTDYNSSRKVSRILGAGALGIHYDYWDYAWAIRCIQD